jgi:D-serine dehydratase
VAGLAEAMTADGYDVRAETAFQRAAIERAVDGVITAEDVIVFKLIAWRPRDQDDVASTLDAGHHLDTAYIERWAAEWQVTDRWLEARRR